MIGYSIVLKLYSDGGNCSQYYFHSFYKSKSGLQQISWLGTDKKRIYKTRKGAERCCKKIESIIGHRDLTIVEAYYKESQS